MNDLRCLKKELLSLEQIFQLLDPETWFYCQGFKQFLRHFKDMLEFASEPKVLTEVSAFSSFGSPNNKEESMNKAQFVEKLAGKTKLTKSQAESFLDATLEIIQKSVARGDEVKLVGFGSFSRQTRKSRNGRNPKTGAPVVIPGTKVPRFKPGKDFKDLLN
jgi:DNA-binding protein HU-beta